MFLALAESQSLQDKVAHFIALGAVTKMEHAGDFWLRLVSENEVLIGQVLEKLQVHELFNHGDLAQMQSVCKVLPFFCQGGSHLYVASQAEYNDAESVAFSRKSFPAGLSVK